MRSNSVPLTKAQLKVLAALAGGSTISAAAEKAGVHHNTIANWRRTSDAFRHECESMDYEKVIHWRDAMAGIAEAAVETLRYVMVNANTPAGVRVRAALAVLDKVTTLPPAPPISKPDRVIVMPKPARGPQPLDSIPPNPTDEHPAQPAGEPAKAAQSCTTPASQPASYSSSKPAWKPPCPACGNLQFGVPDLQISPQPDPFAIAS